MAEVIKVAEIRDELEGARLRAILETRGIPHHLRSYHDSAYDGLFQMQLGWGHVEAPAGYVEEIREVLESIRGDRLRPAEEEGSWN